MTWHWAFMMIQLGTNPLQSTIGEHSRYIQLADLSSPAKLMNLVIWKTVIGLVIITKLGNKCK